MHNENKVQLNKLYRCFDGNYYRPLHVGVNIHCDKLYVTYCSNDDRNKIWICSLDYWNGIQVVNGNFEKRFALDA